jgi:hypothetical protein
MKNQYVGDVNDYLKYALLRAIAGPMSLAVVWMLTNRDTRSDGQKLSYLSQPEKYRRLDPALFDVLNRLVRQDRRSVQVIEEERVLPLAAYVPDLLEDALRARREYFEQVWQLAQGRKLVFFDPDNGLEVVSVPKGRRGSAKYLYQDELHDAYARRHSIVVYQHFPRRPRDLFLREIAETIRAVTDCGQVMALVTSHVAFLIVPQPTDRDELGARLTHFAAHAAPYTTAALSITA